MSKIYVRNTFERRGVFGTLSRSKLGLFVEVVRDFVKSSVLDVLQIIQN